VTKFIHYRSAAGVSYGILNGDTVREIHGGLFGSHAQTGAFHKLSDGNRWLPVTALQDPDEPIVIPNGYAHDTGRCSAKPEALSTVSGKRLLAIEARPILK
jgi:hypothetical protein